MAAIVEFPGPGGRARGLLSKPEEAAPGVLVLHPGRLDDLGRFCDRLADEGFVVLAPDLNYGQPSLREAGSLERQPAIDVASAAQGLLLGQSGLSGQKIGLLAFAEAVDVAADLARHTPEVIGAVVFFRDAAPEQDRNALSVPIMVGDASVDPIDAETLERAAASWRAALDFVRASIAGATQHGDEALD